MKLKFPMILIVIVILFVSACAGNTDSSIAVSAALTQTAVASAPVSVPPTVTGEVGYITGRVRLMAPPTPHMVVYAQDQATGKWASTETEPSDSEVAFTLTVPPGTYRIFAFADNGAYDGYSLDGWNLAVVNVTASQTVADIIVGPPSQSDCGLMFGVPASPDGRFAAVAGPDEACKVAFLTQQAAATSDWQTIDNGRIQFQPNSASWYTNGDLAPKTIRHFVLSASKGQQMNVYLTTDPAASGSTIYAGLAISGANKEVFTPSPVPSWGGVLPANQDYNIEIIPMSDQPIFYTLTVEISALTSTSSAPSMYEPVSQSICDTIEGIAFDTLETNYRQSPSAPFSDPVSGETGDGCLINGSLTGTSDITSTSDIVDRLLQNSGFTEQPAYRADGPTGTATGATRDSALMLINVNWQPVATAQCPADQPIANCNLTPEQKLYTITINTAMYKSDFSLDGHWEDATTGLSLDLYQDGKNIYGHHTIVAQGGNKIDTLDVSINGSLQGQVATVQFQSAFTTDTGTAQITYIDINTIQWKIIDPPDGEYYLPAEATLTRK